MMEIKMARGDLETRTFRLKTKQGGAYEVVPDEIYFTVKKNANEKDFLIQKRIGEGIVLIETGKYLLTIEPEDTDNLAFGTYDFDIEVVKEGTVKKTFCGTLVIGKEVTHRRNEVII